jgi:hypothetical protein
MKRKLKPKGFSFFRTYTKGIGYGRYYSAYVQLPSKLYKSSRTKNCNTYYQLAKNQYVVYIATHHECPLRRSCKCVAQ